MFSYIPLFMFFGALQASKTVSGAYFIKFKLKELCDLVPDSNDGKFLHLLRSIQDSSLRNPNIHLAIQISYASTESNRLTTFLLRDCLPKS